MQLQYMQYAICRKSREPQATLPRPPPFLFRVRVRRASMAMLDVSRRWWSMLVT
jgi:hypothetical protein